MIDRWIIYFQLLPWKAHCAWRDKKYIIESWWIQAHCGIISWRIERKIWRHEKERSDE